MRHFLILFITALTLSNAYGISEFTSASDSIGIKVINNRTYILHKVDKGDNLTTIANRYGVTITQVREANSNVDDKIKIGSILMVPLLKKNPVVATQNDNDTGLVKRLYTVKSGDYLYKVARDFKMEVKRLKELNQLESETLNEGQQLIVEIPVEALQVQAQTQTDNFNQQAIEQQNTNEQINTNNVQPNTNTTMPVVSTENANASMNPASALTRVPKVHAAQEGEYLFALGRNLNVNLDSVRTWNYMEPADNITLNQQVIVGYNYFDSKGNLILSTGADIADVNGFKASAIDAGNSQLTETQGAANLSTLTPEVKLGNIPQNTKEEGIGMKISGNDASANQVVGLHKTAEYGTYIKVTNPSNGRTTAVKIIGKLPADAANSQVVIMLSSAACQRIGVLNNQFPVVLEYNK
ncbi:MAG: hypothetical protein CMO01_19600 [Thalassobius sp.]|nr:hypothetical protein [Thalassovita sp.]